MFLSVVNESRIRPFKFWNQGIHQGMSYNSELYVLFQSYSLEEELKACTAGYQQTEKGLKVCITVSQTHYSLWLSLQSLSAAIEASSLSAIATLTNPLLNRPADSLNLPIYA